MAGLRNLAISALRLHGHTNIAAALRWTAAGPPVIHQDHCKSSASPDFAGALGSFLRHGRSGRSCRRPGDVRSGLTLGVQGVLCKSPGYADVRSTRGAGGGRSRSSEVGIVIVHRGRPGPYPLDGSALVDCPGVRNEAPRAGDLARTTRPTGGLVAFPARYADATCVTPVTSATTLPTPWEGTGHSTVLVPVAGPCCHRAGLRWRLCR
jgi:hypothetical protein